MFLKTGEKGGDAVPFLFNYSRKNPVLSLHSRRKYLETECLTVIWGTIKVRMNTANTFTLVRGQGNPHECEHTVVHVFGISPSPPSPIREVDTQNLPCGAALHKPHRQPAVTFSLSSNFLLRACGRLPAENCARLPRCLLTDTAQLLELPQVLAVHQKGNDPILSHQYFL